MAFRLSLAGAALYGAAILVSYLIIAIPAAAVLIDWDGNQPVDATFDGTFGVADNWDPNQVPDPGDMANFNADATYTVTFDGDEAADDFRVVDGNVTFLSDSSTVRQFDLITGVADANVSGGALTIGSETNPVVVNVADIMNIASNIAGVGSVTVSGSNSELNAGPSSHAIGSGGNTGILTVTDNATANYGGTLNIGVSSNGASQGTVTVTNGGRFNTGHINIATNSSNAIGTMNVGELLAMGRVEQTLAGATLTVGSTSGGAGTLNVNGLLSTFESGTGQITVNATGTINVSSLGLFPVTFNANGNLKIESGGTLTIDTNGVVNARAGLDNSAVGTLDFRDGTLSVTGGAFVPNDGSNYSIDGATPSDIPHLMLGTGASANIGGVLFAVGNTKRGELTVASGATISSTNGVLAAFDSGSIGIATVDGPGSTWTNNGVFNAGNLGSATLTIQNGGAVSNVGPAFVAFVSGSSGDVTVDGEGSTWTNTDSLYIGEQGDGSLSVENGGSVSNTSGIIGDLPNSIGTVTVTDPNSTWTNTNDLYVGGSDLAAGGTGILTVSDQGFVDVGGTLKLWATGTVTLNGGSIVTQTFDHTDGGTFDFIAGSLTINDGLTIGNDPAGVFLNSLRVAAEFAIATPATTTISPFRSLTLNGGSLTTNNLVVNGFFNFTSGTLELTGGTITGLSSINVPTSGEFRATGVHNLPVSAAAGSTITATGNLTLGDASKASGFYSNGNVDLDDSTLTLNDLNDAVFDSGAAITLGSTGTGTLDAANGLTLDFGGNITGYGTVSTPNSAATPLLNNGNITGDDPNAPITLTGYIKGVGTCDNCNITGTDAPGFSTAAVNRGTVSYNGTLEIEIGGTSPGSGYDQLNHILGAGIADLGGTLDVQLVGGFTTAFGDTFDIITATEVQGMFDTESLPTLTGGMQWFVDYQPDSVSLLVALAGDFDLDFDVDGFDFLLWQQGGSPNPFSQSDLNDWEANYGTVVTPLTAASAAVPEPTSLALLSLGCLLALHRFRRANAFTA